VRADSVKEMVGRTPDSTVPIERWARAHLDGAAKADKSALAYTPPFPSGPTRYRLIGSTGDSEAGALGAPLRLGTTSTGMWLSFAKILLLRRNGHQS
jgi:hypothetical protein